MWQAGTYFLILATLGLFLRQARGFGGDRLTRLVMLIIWARFALAALGDVAVSTSVAGFSLIALGTLALTALGVAMMPLRLFATRRLYPFYAIVALGVLSGLLNSAGLAMVSFVAIWAFFVVCALLLYRAFCRHGLRPVLTSLLAVLALPVAMQILSIALGTPKTGVDGSLSYIGAYVHEAVFSVVLLAALVVAVAYPWRTAPQAWAAVALLLGGLFLANYRTIIIAAAPLLVVFLYQRLGRTRGGLFRLAVPVLLLALIVPPELPRQIGERFTEVRTVTGVIGTLIKPPEEFTAREKDLLSARVYIWSAYFYGAIRSDAPQQLVGHGPDTRAPGMSVHPHNEYLRVLFENGILGFVVWLSVLLYQLRLALRILPDPTALVVVAGYLAVFLGALGTSFFNRPEGFVLLAILSAMTWFLADGQPQGGRSRAAQAAG